MTTEERRRRRFSESFRKEQVALIESGKATVKEVSRLYEVKVQNVKNWIKKYGVKGIPETIIITNSKDYNRLRELEKEIKHLKEIIGDERVTIISQEHTIRLAKERIGNDFEKK